MGAVVAAVAGRAADHSGGTDQFGQRFVDTSRREPQFAIGRRARTFPRRARRRLLLRHRGIEPFAIEADAIRSRGGIIIEMRRDVAGLPGAAGAHVSEGGLSTPADFVIHNNATLEELYAALDTIVGGLA